MWAVGPVVEGMDQQIRRLLQREDNGAQFAFSVWGKHLGGIFDGLERRIARENEKEQ